MDSENYIKARAAYKELVKRNVQYVFHRQILNDCPPNRPLKRKKGKHNRKYNSSNKHTVLEKLLTRCHVLRYNANSRWEAAVNKLTAAEIKKLRKEVNA